MREVAARILREFRRIAVVGISDRPERDSYRVAAYLERQGGLGPESFTVSRFVLYSSRDSVGGGPYVVEAAYPLQD